MATRTPRNGPIGDEPLDRLLAGRDPAEAFRSGELIDDLKKPSRNGRSTRRWLSTSAARMTRPRAITATATTASGC